MWRLEQLIFLPITYGMELALKLFDLLTEEPQSLSPTQKQVDLTFHVLLIKKKRKKEQNLAFMTFCYRTEKKMWKTQD